MMLDCHGCRTLRTLCFYAVLFAVLILLCGCASIMRSATSDMMTHLSNAILDNDDLELVKDGAPAYLLMIDSLIAKDPENATMLYTAANLYCSYASLFVKDPERSKKMAGKALSYAEKSLCLSADKTCHLKSMPFENFEKTISLLGKNQLPALYALGNAWASWIMANTDDLNAIADIAHIELIMKQVTQLDETYQDGAAYLYLGTLSSFLPPALGGKPEEGKKMFEQALSISKGKNLMVYVLYAKFYARMVYDRDLHDQLLEQVLNADPSIPGYTLINTWAKQQAKELKNSANDYF